MTSQTPFSTTRPGTNKAYNTEGELRADSIRDTVKLTAEIPYSYTGLISCNGNFDFPSQGQSKKWNIETWSIDVQLGCDKTGGEAENPKNLHFLKLHRPKSKL